MIHNTENVKTLKQSQKLR